MNDISQEKLDAALINECNITPPDPMGIRKLIRDGANVTHECIGGLNKTATDNDRYRGSEYEYGLSYLIVKLKYNENLDQFYGINYDPVILTHCLAVAIQKSPTLLSDELAEIASK